MSDRQLRHKTPRWRVKAKLWDDRHATTGSNEVWAVNFVHDQTAMGTKIRILTIVDPLSIHCRSIVDVINVTRGLR
jgi:putative transposase